MRNLLLVALASLVIGSLSALAYSHYLGDGQKVAKVQAELDTASSSLAKNTQGSQQLKSETEAMTAQIQELTAKNDELKHQVAELKKAETDSANPPPANSMANMMKAGMAQQQEQKLLLLNSRLHLTPEQETAVKAAMDTEAQRGEAMAAKMFQGGKIDAQALADMKGGKSLDQTLNDVLTPDQKTAYQQMKTDEKNSNLETMASVEMNQLAPLLQLSDTQKDQVYTALYQSQANMQDPAWIKSNLTTPSDPMAIINAQAKAKEDALAKVLTPDQLAAYHQQAQSQLEMQKTMMQKFVTPAAAAPASTTTTTTVIAPAP